MLNAAFPQPASNVLAPPLRRWRRSQSHRSSTHGSPWINRDRQPRTLSIASDIGQTYPKRSSTPPNGCRRSGYACRVKLPDHQTTSPTRVALSHDYLLVMRGAERTFAAIAELYSHAPIFTLLYDEHGTDERFAARAISTSPLQRLGVNQRTFRRLLPLYPWAVERLQPPPSDVLISSSSAFAHGVVVPEGAVHVCYCHAPFR